MKIGGGVGLGNNIVEEGGSLGKVLFLVKFLGFLDRLFSYRGGNSEGDFIFICSFLLNK